MWNTNIDYNSIRFIEFYGLRRAGNHATLAWLMANLNTLEGVHEPEPLISPFPKWGFISQRLGDVYHINDVGSPWTLHHPEYLRGIIDSYGSDKAKTIILSYEDLSPNYSVFYDNKELFFMLKNSEKWSVIRNWDNLLASRAKSYSAKVPSRKQVFNLSSRTILSYIRMVSTPESECSPIHFDSWCQSKDYRDHLMKKAGLPNYDIVGHRSNAGGGSYFDSTNVLNRKLEKIPEEWQENLAKTKDLIYKAQKVIDEQIAWKD